MKLTKLFISLILISLTIPAVAQDYRLNLGGGTIRYDSDTAKFKFNKPLSREYGAKLFDFNDNQFYWSPVTGLNSLQALADTVSSQHLIIHRDTVINEIIKSRSYTFFKPAYNHIYDLYDLFVQYKSVENGALVEDKTINLFNYATTIYDNQALEYMLSEAPFSTGWNFTTMKKGQYYVVVSYEYEFENIASNSEEKIEAVILNLDNAAEYAHNIHSFTHSDALKSGQINSAQMSCIISPTNSSNKNINVSFQGTSSGNLKIKLNKLRIIAILIN